MVRNEAKSRGQRLLLYAAMLCLLQFFLVLNVYAKDDLYGLPTQGGDTEDNGTGTGTGGSSDLGTLGISIKNSGYRVYLESAGGQVVDNYVIDLWFDNIPPSKSEVDLWEHKDTTIGGATVLKHVRYSDAMKKLLPGLVEPIGDDDAAQGEYLNTWFEQRNSNYPESTNAEIFLSAVYKLAGKPTYKISDYIEKFHLGQYRIVVEAIYWFGYVRMYEYLPVEKQVQETVDKIIEKEIPDPEDPTKTILTTETVKETVTRIEYEWHWINLKDADDYKGAGPYKNPITGEIHDVRHYNSPDTNKVTWVYGTIKEIAAFEKSQIGNEKFVKGTGMDYVHPSCQYGTRQLRGYTNGLMATTLHLAKVDDGFSGMSTISSPSYYLEPNDLYSYDQILDTSQGFGIHIIRKEQASEKWATWDTTAYGGSVGKSPGVTPKMPPLAGMENVTTTWRDVTVIKYYEERSKNEVTGKYEYNTVSGPYKTKSICLQIEIQTEPGWTLKEWHKAYDDPNEALYQDIKTKFEVNNIPTTVTMEPDGGLDTLVIWHVREAPPKPKPTPTPQPTPGTVDTTGQLELSESEITQSYFTNKVDGNTNPQLKFSWSNPHIASGEMCYDGTNHDFSWQDNGLTLKVKLDDTKFSLYRTILGTQTAFSPRLYTEDNQHMATLDATGASEYDLTTFKAKFTIWRGQDQPTIAKYIPSPGDSQLVDTLLDKTTASNKYSESGARKTSNGLAEAMTEYKESVQMHFNVDANGDYIISTTCQNGDSRCSRGGSDIVDVLKDNQNNNYQFKGSVTVQFYNGEPNTPQTTIKDLPSLANPQSIMRRQPAYGNAKYNPYVQMSYQTTEQANTTDGSIVYVLGSYEREFNAQAALKLSWKENYYSGTNYSMLVRQDQWSTHATAMQKYGKNILLPGGAIYQVTTNPSSGTTLGGTLTLEAWYPDILPEYKDGMVTIPNDWNGTNGADEFEKLVEDSKNAIFDSARLEFRVKSGQNTNAWNGIQIKPGVGLDGIGHTGLKAQTDSKYNLVNEDVNAQNTWRADVQGSGVQKTEIKVTAKPDGKVEIGGNGGTLNKTQNAEAIQSTQAAKEADNYTSLMTNFIGQLQRNSGNDTTTTFGNYWAKDDGHWYNEAFGFKVNYYKATIKVNIPKNDGSGRQAGVTAVLDPNLGPVYTGTQTKFNSVNTGQFFMTLSETEIGQFGDDIVHFPVPQSGYILSSQPFYIASFTVQDND